MRSSYQELKIEGRRLVWLTTVIDLLLIFYTTLFPFDFFVRAGPSAPEVLRGFDLKFTQAYVFADLPRNMLLFVPFGFGLSGLLASWSGNKWRLFTLVLFAGLLLSALLEIVQAVALLRFPPWRTC